jgi:hypothetical protein
MALVEYLYVDEQRLDTYFEQISSPVTYDKVPTWNAEIGFTGPKAGGAQQRFARPYTTHEKIAKFTEYLEDEGLVGHGRATEDVVQDPKELFRLETCLAKRVFIPKEQLDSNRGGLSLWISLMDRSSLQGWWQEQSDRSVLPPGNLFLLEDYRADDSLYVPVFSTYSVLDLLIDEPERLDEQERQFGREVSLRQFSADPTVALSKLGAQVGPARKIRSIYRVRKIFVDWDSEPGSSVAIFGYPIFIAEGTDTV